VAEHLLGSLEVGDDAVLHRADRRDVAWRTSKHFFGVAADCFNLVSDVVHFTATIEGSFRTMPAPRAKTQVLAVPRSIARS
jgi:hypothetical protein